MRDYADADRDTCLGIFDTNVPRFFRPPEREELSAFLSSLPGPYLLLVHRSGGVLGCGGYALAEDSGVADLCWGMVRSDWHGRGLGRVLTEVRIDRIRAEGGARAISLRTSQHTAGFYERLGFRTTSVVPDGYGPGLDRHDMLLELGSRPPRMGGAAR